MSLSPVRTEAASSAASVRGSDHRNGRQGRLGTGPIATADAPPPLSMVAAEVALAQDEEGGAEKGEEEDGVGRERGTGACSGDRPAGAV